MNDLVRRVIARYEEDPETLNFNQSKSWMDYMKSKAEGTGKVPSAIPEMIGDKEELNRNFSTYNPYDYSSPSDKPKDLQDSAVFINDPFESGYGLYNAPDSLFKEEGDSSLHQWYKSRRIDFTQDEEEQQPALSITRKYSEDLTGTKYPIIVNESDLRSLMMTSKLAASLKNIVDADAHYLRSRKQLRANSCTVRWANKTDKKQIDRGLFVFDVVSRGNTGEPPSGKIRKVRFQFLRGESEGGYKSYAEYPVQISCDCPSFLFWGAQWYALKENYMYMPSFRPDSVPPQHQYNHVKHKSNRYPDGKKYYGRGLNFRVCKHILAAYRVLMGMKIEHPYREFPSDSPPSRVINKDVWKDIMGFEFNEDNIKERILSSTPKIPDFFIREKVTPAVLAWFHEVWLPRDDEQKIKALNTMAGYPERIFYILIQESFLNRKFFKPPREMSRRLVDEGYKIMTKIIKEDSKDEPESTPEVPKEFIGKGTGPLSNAGPDGISAYDAIMNPNKFYDELVKNQSKPKMDIRESLKDFIIRKKIEIGGKNLDTDAAKIITEFYKEKDKKFSVPKIKSVWNVILPEVKKELGLVDDKTWKELEKIHRWKGPLDDVLPKGDDEEEGEEEDSEEKEDL